MKRFRINMLKGTTLSLRRSTVANTNDRYKQLAETTDLFDAVVPTTSTKQAVANILAMLDFKWAAPKWDEISKIVNNKEE